MVTETLKANKAPDKIYIQPNAHDGWFVTNNLTKSLTEYTRTDAFIEKAWKFIDDTFHGTSIEGWGGESVDVVMSDSSVYKDDLFENFKNYMKVE